MNATVPASPIEVTTKTMLVVQCAWCGRMKLSGAFAGPSMPLVHEMGGHRVSHGICPSCFARLEAAGLAARRSGRAFALAA